MKFLKSLRWIALLVLGYSWVDATFAVEALGQVRMSIVAGDENCPERGEVGGKSEGSEAEFHPGARPAKHELVKHVNCAAYNGSCASGTDYDALTPEATGLVEIGDQGTRSEAFSTAYEKNLACLVRDLRNEFNAPFLPAVVAAVGFGGTNMNGNTRKIFEARMAAGNPAKYPEPAGSVKSIDTRPFYQSLGIFPSGQAVFHNTNAESYLETGEAMVRAMLELMKDGK